MSVKKGKTPLVQKKQWYGSDPNVCQLCTIPLAGVFFDGKVFADGKWAIMCPYCHANYGVGIGIGLGQEYTYNINTKVWVKTAG